MTIQQKEIMASIGDAPEEVSSKVTTNKVIRNFVELFKNLLNGTQEDIEVTRMVGGASINNAFRNFSSFKAIKPEDGLTDEVVINALRNSHGTRVPMFISEHCFIQLSIRQIKRLKEPSVAFVDTIKNILLEIVDYCTSKIVEQEKNRFPRLYKRINKVACDIVNERLQPTKEFVEKIVNMQLNYINIRHPEFVLLQKPIPEKKEVIKEEPIYSTPTPFAADEAELEDCKTLQKLVIQYYEIVCNSLQYSMLPKAIMMELVNHVKNNIHEELEEKIASLGDVVKELTKESEAITQKREQTLTKLEELERAKTLLQTISEVNM
uniref:GED domain-containing protein n=1 Tax=Panagrolaimus sp. PS1159 TaxID=55785 RepID=A0AC35GV16_9BILA